MLRAVIGLLSPGGHRARLSILMFHRVLQSADPMIPEIPDAGRFDRILQWLRSWFNVLPLDEAVALLARGGLPPCAAAITFDDGYADNFKVALPLLQRHGLSATFFIATGFIEGGRMWNDTIIEAVRRCESPQLDLESIALGVYDISTIQKKHVALQSLIDKLKYLPANDRLRLSEEVAGIGGAKLPDDLMMSRAHIRGL